MTYQKKIRSRATYFFIPIFCAPRWQHWVLCVLAVCSVGISYSLVIPPDFLSSEFIEIFNPNAFGITAAPLMICLLQFGYTTYSDCEYVRRGKNAEILTNLRWIIVSVILVSTFCTVNFLVCEFMVAQGTWQWWRITGIVLMWIHYTMQGLLTDILAMLLVEMHVQWNIVTPLMISINTIFFRVFSTWHVDILEYGMYFLRPAGISLTAFDVRQFSLIDTIPQKIMPFCSFAIVLCVLIFVVSHWFDHLPVQSSDSFAFTDKR